MRTIRPKYVLSTITEKPVLSSCPPCSERNRHILCMFLIVSALAMVSAVPASAGPGDLDPTFGTLGSGGKVFTAIGTAEDRAYSVAIQFDGKIVAAGYSNNGSDDDFALVRYNSNGTLDPTFDSDGKVTTAIGSSRDRAYAVTIQSDGKIIAAGESDDGSGYDFALVRYTTDGSLDATFDSDGKVITSMSSAAFEAVYSLAIQPDGKIVAAGYSQVSGGNDDFALARYNTDGTLDTTFDSDGKVTTTFGIPATSSERAYSMAIQSDGKIVAAGGSQGDPGVFSEFALVRYNSDGTLDTTFDSDGKVTTPIGSDHGIAQSVAIQSDGKLVAAGSSSNGTALEFAVVRYNADGSLDTTFDSDGKVTTAIGGLTETAYSVAIQPDGRIVAAGRSYNGNDYDFALVRYNTDGTLDTTFGSDGKVTTPFGSGHNIARAVRVQSDSKILVAGYGEGGAYDLFVLMRYGGLPNVCGDGTLEPGEVCDDGNTIPGDCCSETCQYESAGTVCRSSAGPCDVEETCTGWSANCPADSVETSGTECRAIAGVCDVPEQCDGASPACPVDGFVSAGTVCISLAGPCDIEETCTGSSANCPADGVKASGTECRASAGVCDVAEQCDGASTTCPVDSFAEEGEVCRSAAGACDEPETCTGSGVLCPVDGFLGTGIECRPSAGACDVSEHCTGSSAACPVDGKSTAECRAEAGHCDVAEACDGVSDDCPADGFEPASTQCSDTDGNVCTIAGCDGFGGCDQSHILEPLGTPCEADGDLCTNDQCDGGGSCFSVGGVICPACQTCDSGLGCVVAFKDACFQPAEPFKALLLLKDKGDDSKDKLIWKWIKGEKTDFVDFGNPLTTDDYTLCIYETVGGQPSVLLSATAPAGDQCAGLDCWKALSSTGFKYKDKELTPEGLDTIILKSGGNGKAKIIVKGKGANLGLPTPLDVELPVTVQLQSGNGECWQADYFSVGVKKNEPDFFKAKAGSPSGAFIDMAVDLFD